MSAELQRFQKKMLEIKTVKEGLQEAHKQTPLVKQRTSKLEDRSVKTKLKHRKKRTKT